MPDIDFNIKAGNSLVGLLDKHAIPLELQDMLPDIQRFSRNLQAFRQNQLLAQTASAEPIDLAKAKAELLKEEKALVEKANRFVKLKNAFHWLIEFNAILESGGFDVIIGNPPYVEYSKVKKDYTISEKEYKTFKCGNLYAYCIERSFNVLKQGGRFGMIVPISAFANQSMLELQRITKQKQSVYLSSFHQRPAQLFDGVLQRLSILLLQNDKADSNSVFTTPVYRWYASERESLFSKIKYTKTSQDSQTHFLKFGSQLETRIHSKFLLHQKIEKYLAPDIRGSTSNFVSYRTAGGGYWWTFLNTEFQTESLSNKRAFFDKKYDAKVFMAALNSSLFWWYYYTNYDLFNLKDYMIFSFRMNYPAEINILKQLSRLSIDLEKDYKKNVCSYQINSKTRGKNETLTYQNYKSKPIIDEIDKVLAAHYGFSEEELNFIINYDIKYRMGKGAAEEEE